MPEELQNEQIPPAEQEGGAAAPETVETVEQPVETERPFLTTPFEEYNVQEGLLLLLVIMAFLAACWKLIQEVF